MQCTPGPYTGQTVELPLPAGVSAAEVAWVSVWCRQYSLDLGHAIIATDGVSHRDIIMHKQTYAKTAIAMS